MSEKREDQHPENEKLWDKTFEDEDAENKDAQGHLSRMARRKQTSHDSRITTILVLIIVIFAAMPVVYWAQHQKSFNHPVQQEKVAASSSHCAASSHKKQHAKSQRHVKSKQNSSSQSAASQSAANASSSIRQSASSTSTAASSSSQPTSSYVTVRRGDGLYRIAARNGLTVEQLARMNGLTSRSAIHPGQRLQVR